MATGPSDALCVSSVCGRGCGSRVCALDRVRGSSFVMRGDVCGSRSYPLPTHRHTRSHTHLQSLERFLRGWMGIPLLHSHYQSQVLPGDPNPLHHTSLLRVFIHFLTQRASNMFIYPAPLQKSKNKILKRKKKKRIKENKTPKHYLNTDSSAGK